MGGECSDSVGHDLKQVNIVDLCVLDVFFCPNRFLIFILLKI